MSLNTEAIKAAVAEHGSIRKAATALGRDESTLRRTLSRTRRPGTRDSGHVSVEPEKTTVEHKGDTVHVTAPEGTTPDKVMELVRENGLDPDDWVIVSTTLNKWNALGKANTDGENPLRTLRQVKVTLRPAVHLVFPEPVSTAASLALRPLPPIRRDKGRPRLAIVEYDHQAPYHDPLLDAALCAMHDDLNPDEQNFGGDLMDFPTISRHPDHPAAAASVRECLEGGHGILVRRREAVPRARRRKIKGNHDWRPEGELLLRAERMAYIAPVGETVPALSLRRLLHLDALGVELVEHPLGWEHAEIELVPGPHGLVMRHGWMTGHNTAGRSLQKRGRSILVGHGHTREHAFQWDPSMEVEREAAMVGTASRVRGEAFAARLETAGTIGGTVDHLFPHFAVLDSWLQGAATVTMWDDGTFNVEHARWDGTSLRWRDRRWTP